ncbi:response regulator transcription factor [Eubacterium limosum]|uniref:response regulator transcription factor n=1 Tax=Eubacterium limosum TaxID=1736 RepID=UPI001D082FF7|nr:response regulator transcription factor [Eubacterium limosum]MCB6570571.1 response regulator transcription factor [Eubacterium limosum]
MELKILIVEDEKQIASFIKMELEHEGYLTIISPDGRDALEQVKNNAFDAILLDIMLPYINGIEVCKRIREFSQVPIIMLTAKDDISDKVIGLDSGANDYITKPFDVEELFARIRVATRTLNMNQSKSLECSGISMNLDTHQVVCNKKIINLTKKEFDLLEQLLLNTNIVMSRDRLLQKVWNYDYFGDSNVVDVTIKHLRIKLDDTENKIITTVRGYGYVIRK